MLTSENPKSVSTDINFSFISSLKNVQRVDWNALLEDDNPFLCYEFLSALEQNDCLGEKYGWYPHHLIVRDVAGALIAATPLYIKTNSYGEFVFDWSWASAYEQAGLNYYPKLISSIPYTPATGKRLLLSPKLSSEQQVDVASKMIQATLSESEKLNMSGTHWLFNEADECNYFREQGQMFRLGCQYHWHNHNYESFDQFLDKFISRKRKKVKQERRYVKEQNIEIKRMHGNELNEEQWQQIHRFYESTFYRKSGIPTLSLDFFKEVGSTMGEQIVLVLSYSDEQLVACAINFRSSHTLYGRFWGCTHAFHSLHFEACYYQGIEYAIFNKLKVFEPGAQGEHKISRGFLPTKTWSAHSIHDSRFEPSIRDFCKREQEYMQQDYDELMMLSPYRS
ncbi:MAG: GNAT family N-acetyltransferase [Gammaproteobacteria bacterium]|nr:GNAT family N-acetyltransferase [Gammaproteobacteria bacterium]